LLVPSCGCCAMYDAHAGGHICADGFQLLVGTGTHASHLSHSVMAQSQPYSAGPCALAHHPASHPASRMLVQISCLHQPTQLLAGPLSTSTPALASSITAVSAAHIAAAVGGKCPPGVGSNRRHQHHATQRSSGRHISAASNWLRFGVRLDDVKHIVCALAQCRNLLGNQLTGTLPAAWSAMASLQSM
jgi:hypothetical protein